MNKFLTSESVASSHTLAVLLLMLADIEKAEMPFKVIGVGNFMFESAGVKVVMNRVTLVLRVSVNMNSISSMVGTITTVLPSILGELLV